MLRFYQLILMMFLTSDSVYVKTFSEFENAVENVGGTIDVDK